MPLDIQEIIAGMREIAAVMDPEDDFQTIVNAENQMNARDNERQEAMKEGRRKLKALAAARDASRKAATRPENVPSAAAHAMTIKGLDSERRALVKAINKAETELADKEDDLKHLREQILDLEATDEAEEHPVDGTALRLAIYNGMGFEPILDKNGDIHKLLIRSRSGDVHCVSLDGSSESVPDATTLWKLAAS